MNRVYRAICVVTAPCNKEHQLQAPPNMAAGGAVRNAFRLIFTDLTPNIKFKAGR